MIYLGRKSDVGARSIAPMVIRYLSNAPVAASFKTDWVRLFMVHENIF